MDLEELKKLIPGYVNNTLTDEERAAVRQALERSAELRDDLEFWRKAGAVVRMQADYRLAGHPEPETLLNFADGTLQDSQQRLAIDRHLQSCESCRKEAGFLRSTAPIAEPGAPVRKLASGIPAWLRQRPAISFALALLLIVMGVSIARWLSREQEPPQEFVRSELPATHEQVLLLAYHPRMRGMLKEGNSPVLNLDSATTSLRFIMIVPASVESTLYSVAVEREGDRAVQLDGYYAPGRYGGGNDTLGISMKPDAFRQPGYYFLIAMETLPASAQRLGITPNEYRIGFEVKKAAGQR